MKSNQYFFKILVLISEFIIINISCKLVYFLRYGDYGEPEEYYISFFIVFNLAWLGVSLFNNAYESKNLLSLKAFIRNLFSTLFIHIFIISLYIVSVKAQYLSRLYLIYTYSTSLLTIVTFRALLIIAYRYYNSVSYTIRKIVLLGEEKSVTELFNFFDSKNTSVYRFLEKIDPYLSPEDRKHVIEDTLEEVKAFCLREQINEMYIALNLTDEEMIDDLSHFADDNFIYFRIVTDFNVLKHRSVAVDFFGHIPIISLRKEPLSFLINRILKRAFDIAFSLGVILFVFPIAFPIFALLIRLESKGPVIFKQLRSGREKKEFWCYKFRTMEVNAEADLRQATKDDRRITKVGRFLRQTSLDELPQFINVLKGDMSVVGPRPHMLMHTNEYSRIIESYLLRHFITPGITGHAQINGLRGETIDPGMMKKRVEYDTWYIENWSLYLDIKIVLITIWKLFRGSQNAY